MRYLAPLSSQPSSPPPAGLDNAPRPTTLRGWLASTSGDFSGSEIQLTLEQIDEHTAVGHSLHKGQRSDMKGLVQPSEHGLHFELKELGNSPYEGVFTFDLDTATLLNGGDMEAADQQGARRGLLYAR